MNYLNNKTYFSFVEFLANSSRDYKELDVRLRVELGLITGGCGVKCETDPNYIGALEQAIKLLTDCGSLEQFHQKLINIK